MKKSEHFFLSKIFWHLFTTLFQGFYQFPKCIIAGIVEHSKSHVGTECGQCNYSVKIKVWGFMLQHLEPPVVSILQTQGSSFTVSLSTKSPVLFCWDSAIQDSDRAVPQLGDKDIMNTHSTDQPSAERERWAMSENFQFSSQTCLPFISHCILVNKIQGRAY